MTADPNVDRQLGELWAISARMVELIRDDFAAARGRVAEWSPAPMPTNYRPRRGDCG
jgi:hypothetical protein